jgi:hypothetical protein
MVLRVDSCELMRLAWAMRGYTELLKGIVYFCCSFVKKIKKSKTSLKAAQLRKTKERDAIKLEDMHGDPKGRRKLALKVFAEELRRGISKEEFEGLAGGSAADAKSLGMRSAHEVLAKPRKRTNGELVDETKWVEYTGMDRTALITKGRQMMRGDWVQACKVAGQ